MVRPRIIPILLIDSARRVIKTQGFGERTYIGDPFNILRLFNEKAVDEIVVLDIDATNNRVQPDLGFLRELSAECFMPMAYGGGLNTPSVCEKVCRAGIEKVVIKTELFNTSLIADISSSLGAQAIVGCFDYVGSGMSAKLHRGYNHLTSSFSLLHAIKIAEDSGIGEVIIQSVDRDGARNGFDTSTIEAISSKLSLPTIALGGARDFQSFAPALLAGASALASGSAFCFIGNLRAVLVTYPEEHMIDSLIEM